MDAPIAATAPHRFARHGSISDAQFIEAYIESGCSPGATADALGISLAAVGNRRRRLRALGHDLPTIRHAPGYNRPPQTIPLSIGLDALDCSILVFGDTHIWPRDLAPMPPIQAALLEVAHRLAPRAIICNGDLIDATRISSHPRLRNQKTPTVLEEINAGVAFLAQLPAAENSILTYSNHDMRVDKYLANMAPEMADCLGGLVDRLPHGWQHSYRVTINDTVEVCHSWHNGMHAGHNNAWKSGRSFVTGHTHQLGVRPVVDLNGTRYGVECGICADPMGPQFEYVAQSPTRWEAGFVVLTFTNDGTLLPPETCSVVNGVPMFRGAAVLRPRVRVPAVMAGV